MLFEDNTPLLKPCYLPCPSSLSPMDTLRYREIRYRLPDYHLSRVDRLTMAHGIEARVPFLRNKIVDYVLSCPAETLLVPNNQKGLLKCMLKNALSKDILHRKKQPFTSPFVSWLKEPLKPEVYDLLLTPRYYNSLGLKREGLERLLTNYMIAT